VRTALANAGMPLEENLTKPLLKSLQEQQQKMMQQMASAAGPQNQLIAASGVGATVVTSSDGVSGNMIEMQEKSVELQAQHQKRQREALARVLTPEQLKVIEDEHKMELQMQRAQIKMMRAQQEAGLLDPAQGGFVQGEAVTLTPSVVVTD